jgi:hypothetical protein
MCLWDPSAFDPLDGSWLLIRVVYLRRTLASYPSMLLFAGLGRGFAPVGPLTFDPSPFLWPLLRSKVDHPFIEIPLPKSCAISQLVLVLSLVHHIHLSHQPNVQSTLLNAYNLEMTQLYYQHPDNRRSSLTEGGISASHFTQNQQSPESSYASSRQLSGDLRPRGTAECSPSDSTALVRYSPADNTTRSGVPGEPYSDY